MLLTGFMGGLCKYKAYLNNRFFEPERTGRHSIRLFDIAVFDVAVTALFAYIIAWYYEISFIVVLVVFMILGIIVHRLFCVNTTLNVAIFGYV